MAFILSYAGVPFLGDSARVVHLHQPHGKMEDPKQLPPKKHQTEYDLIDQLNKIIPNMYLEDFGLPGDYPGKDLGAIAYRKFQGPHPNPHLAINSYYYPTTASRWSVFRGLATASQVEVMLAATQHPSLGNQPETFVMQAEPVQPQLMTRLNDPVVTTLLGAQTNVNRYRIETEMYLLPPRPLAEHGKQFDGLYLITLVDERYWWQYSPVSLNVTRTTDWNDLISQLGIALGIVIGFVDIPPVLGYPEPDSHFWTSFENAAVLLDAVAWNIGDVIVRQYDGSYKFLYAYESKTVARTNRGQAQQVLRLAGGEIFASGNLSLTGDRNKARNTVTPSHVNFSFPKYVIGDDPVPHYLNDRYNANRATSWFEDSFGEEYNVLVPLLSGNDVFAGNLLARDSAPQSGVKGTLGRVMQVHDTAKAVYSGENQATLGQPLNASGLTAMAMEFAASYWDYLNMEGLDEVYPGTYNWIPEGFHDLIWTYSTRAGLASLRVMRTQWNQMVTEMQHSTPPPFLDLVDYDDSAGARPNAQIGPWIPGGMGGHSVAQTWRDSVSGQIFVTTLSQSLAPTDYTAQFQGIAYFPTQNRWRGEIEDESILFEGTSGGTSVGIVHRGIDGSLANVHAAGSTVQYLTPNVSYGTNLVTFEKMGFVYPAEWTSGGIQGVNVVPPLQSVQALDGTGKTLNSKLHFSGAVLTYDTTRTGDNTWSRQELVWLVERNEEVVVSGTRYDGQLLGYSADGPVAPIYAVNADQGTTEELCFASGLTIFGSPDPTTTFSDPLATCPLPFQDLTSDAGADSVGFAPCDFITTDTGTTSSGRCDDFKDIEIRTRGVTRSISLLDANCNVVTISIRDGLVQRVNP